MSNLTNNTAELNKILAAVNALPEAGGGGINPTGEIEITENGTYDVTNYASAEVNVPSKEPVLQEGNATPTKSQQTVEPPSGVDGFSKVVVEPIPDEYIVPEGATSIYDNGMYEVSKFAYAYVNVSNVPAVIEPLEVTENGTYTAPDGVDGYSPVTVTVHSENLDAEISEQAAKIDQLLTILDSKAAGGALPADPVLEELNVTENGVYEPGNGADGFSKVTVAVPTGGGSDGYETCTLRIQCVENEDGVTPAFLQVVYPTVDENGSLVLRMLQTNGVNNQDAYREIENVVVGQCIGIYYESMQGIVAETSNAEVMINDTAISTTLYVRCTKANDIAVVELNEEAFGSWG